MRWLSTAAWLLLIPALLLTAFLAVAGSGELYGVLQDRYVDEVSTGVSDADRYRINECLAEYIRGERDDIAVDAVVYGVEQAAFNETEILHMKDVRALFDLARTAKWSLLLGVGAWAVSDFTRAFLWFHEMLFTNDLWLLNPATDLMIRMLPEAFFADIAAAAVIAMAVLLLAAGFAAWGWFGRSRKRGSDI